ncbi:ADP-ribosyltransferse [Mycobacterium marinum M]|uniref:ADP-ribosyltransferse n=1 Tax=Mycobacterium marinum (strain ATCC BAA-535 / M) TaxID=216594 RepID=B2HNR5_MYCMM|nr:ADP-ribosyltransferase [Mycobacterium marinum]ACC43870.1 ADP-ribosyltransferse [Mycobacterium marinum M]
MAPLAVDPAALDGAGAAVVAAGEGLEPVIASLSAVLAGCAGMAGDDPVGAAVGRGYDRAAAKVFSAMAATRNGLCSIGDGVRMSAHNYSLAEAMSDVTRRAAALPAPTLTTCIVAASAPSAVGTADSAPAGWGWIAPYIGMIWPTGNLSKLRTAASEWTAEGTKFALVETQLTAGPLGAIRSQQLPESGLIERAFTDAYVSTTSVVGQCQTIAAQLDRYADQIDEVHAAILDLLARICDPLTGIKEVWEVLTGEDEDEIERIAHEIAAVVDHFAAEANALSAQFNAALVHADTVLDTMARHAAREWDQFLHGNPVGAIVDFAGQRLKGLGEAAWGLAETALTYNQIRALLDPLGYARDVGSMAQGMAPLVGLGDDHAPSVLESWKQLGKEVTHWDDWSRSPGEALGKSEFDLANLFLPGGPISKAASKGRDLADGLQGLKARLRPNEMGEPNPLKRPDASAAEHTPPSTMPQQEAKQPAAAPQPKPLRPSDGHGLPHSPTESKAPPVDKPATGEPVKPAGAQLGEARAPGAAARGEKELPAQAEHSEQINTPVSAPGPVDGSDLDPTPARPHTSRAAPASAMPHLAGSRSTPSDVCGPNVVSEGGSPGGHSTPAALDEVGGAPGASAPGEYHGTGGGPGDHGTADGGQSLIIVDGLHADDLSALADYTGSGYLDLNNALRSDILDASLNARVAALNSALQKLPTYDGTVVRGTDLPPEVVAQYLPGEVITEVAFLSTTTDPAVAQSPTFAGNVEFRIVSRTGRDVSSVSMFPDEREILFPAGTKFYVIDKTLDALTGRTIIDMIER